MPTSADGRPDEGADAPGADRRADEAGDEELPHPPDGRWRRGSRRRSAALFLVLALAAAALVARVVAGGGTQQGAHPSSPAPPLSSNSPSPGATDATSFAVPNPARLTRSLSASVPTASVPTVAGAHLPYRRGSDPARCPGDCQVSRTLPAGLRAAIDAAFPEAEIGVPDTVRLAGNPALLWFRTVEAHFGSEILSLQVEAHSRHDRTGLHVTTTAQVSDTRVEAELGEWHVVASVLDVTGARPDVNRLAALATDPRLLS